MNDFAEFDVVDCFEDQFGSRKAVKQVCDFMVSYLAATTNPLPEIAAGALRVAIAHKNGQANLTELGFEDEAISQFLRSNRAWTNYEDPHYCAIHAVRGIIDGYITLSWRGGASELAYLFWEMMEKFDYDKERLNHLLKEYFS